MGFPNAVKVKKELQRLGITVYKNTETQASFVKKGDVVKALKALASEPLKAKWDADHPPIPYVYQYVTVYKGRSFVVVSFSNGRANTWNYYESTDGPESPEPLDESFSSKEDAMRFVENLVDKES